MADSTRTLILMRHAKSGWGAPELPDHARSLDGRGPREAASMAGWIDHQQLIPEIILASTAVRVRETVDALGASWSDPPPVSYSDDLYLAAPESILRRIRCDGLDFARVMVVAHNPGLSVLAGMLSGRSIAMPTAAVVTFRLRIEDWQQLTASSPVEAVTYQCP